ncbi:hypothetical protein ACFQ51_52895 [Streptomyces kaempferi]
MDQAAIAQAKYQAELAKLTPSARQTFNAFVDLRDAFSTWSKALQPTVMPIFTRALVSLRRTLPSLTPFVKGAASAIKELQDRASASIKSPFWQGFKKDLQGSVKPAIVGLGVAIGNLIKGMAGIIDAFLPHMDGISTRMQRITKRFADWGANLKGSPEFERFLKYVSDNAPKVGDLLGKAMGALLAFSQAIAPTSTVIFAVVGPLLDGVKWLATNMPGLVQTLWGLYAVSKAVAIATKAWAVAEGLYSTAMTIATLETWSFAAALAATGWTEIVALVVAIVAVIAALVAGIIYAYKHVGWFRTAVDAAWSAIKTATLFLWEGVLKPAFNGIVIAVQWLGAVFAWLWTNAIKPAFDFIVAAARILLTVLVVIVILPIVTAIRVLGAIAMWLWNNAIKPAFQGIATAAMWLWANVFQPVFQQIGDKAKWLYNNAIKPAWDAIKGASRAMWENALRPTFQAFQNGLREVGKWGTWLWKNALKRPSTASSGSGKPPGRRASSPSSTCCGRRSAKSPARSVRRRTPSRRPGTRFPASPASLSSTSWTWCTTVESAASGTPWRARSGPRSSTSSPSRRAASCLATRRARMSTSSFRRPAGRWNCRVARPSCGRSSLARSAPDSSTRSTRSPARVAHRA